MRVGFRQGVLSTQSGEFLNFNASGNVDLLANTRPLSALVADGQSDYLHVEESTILNAWSGSFIPNTDYWLYWDFNTSTFQRTFGFTDIEPQAQPTAPSNPQEGQMWFNTATNIHYVYSTNRFVKIHRVLAARLNTGQFFSESIDAPLFTGTQIGNTNSVFVGRVLYGEDGSPVHRDDGRFFTTGDQFFSNASQVTGIRLESNVVRGRSSVNSLSEYQVVAFNSDGTLRSANYGDVENSVIAILTENLAFNESGNVIVQGTITNPAWDWSDYPAGTRLWVLNGDLTPNDPHITDSNIYRTPQAPSAKVLFRDTVIFDQGLGGIGPIGPSGINAQLMPATSSMVGGVILSIDADDPLSPTVVGDNDPRISGGPFAPITHSHTADTVLVDPITGLQETDLQNMLEELVALSGMNTGGISSPSGNITGNLTVSGISTLANPLTVLSGGISITGPSTFNGKVSLTSAPISPFDAVPKNYVDQLTSGLLWLDSVCLVNLIADDVLDPSTITPNDGDAYIVPLNSVDAWADFNPSDVVRWNAEISEWVNGGQLDSANFPSLRFIVSGTSDTPASGSLIGQDNNIATWNGTEFSFVEPINTNTVYVSNKFSSSAFSEYTYDANQIKWIQTGGNRTGISVDDLTIKQTGNTLSTIPYVDGGQVDAATYRGVELSTIFSDIDHSHDDDFAPISHTHISTDIIFSPVMNILEFGTSLNDSNSNITASDINSALIDTFKTKANNSPYYSDITNLPIPNTVNGMIASMDSDKSLRVSLENEWKEVALNDGTVQNHQHRIAYDITFYSGGNVALQSNELLGRVNAARQIEIPANSTIYIRVSTPPLEDVEFQFSINGVLTNIVARLSPTLNDGLFNVTDTGSDSFILSAGDYIELLTPSSIDLNVSNLSITLVAESDTGII